MKTLLSERLVYNIESDVLDFDFVIEYPLVARWIIDEVKELEEQNSQMLAALKNALDFIQCADVPEEQVFDLHESTRIVRAAIADAEGETK